jgi:hypothetical protein
MYVPRMRRLEPSVLETADGIFLKVVTCRFIERPMLF